MKTRTIVLLTVLILMLPAATIPVRGVTLIGFRYRSRVDTEFTICPHRVARQDADVITLTTGEQFKVIGVPAADLTRALSECSSFVKVDRQHKFVSVRKRVVVCGMRPEMNQLITIPLVAAERVQTHYAADFAEVEPIPAQNQKIKKFNPAAPRVAQ